jgi:hypothetical protein
MYVELNEMEVDVSRSASMAARFRVRRFCETKDVRGLSPKAVCE